MAPERAWMDEIFGTMGYVDATREVTRESELYSWWPNSEQAENLNLGLRFENTYSHQFCYRKRSCQPN